MTNAEWMISQGMQFENLEARFYKSLCLTHYRIFYCGEEIGTTAIIPQNAACAIMHWLDEYHQVVLLQDSEKTYLSAIVKPFKDKVEDITKRGLSGDREYIIIETFNDYQVQLPAFQRGSRYKEMETGKKYSIEELGL